MRAILEALLYATPEPLSVAELKEAFGAERGEEVDAALEALASEYAREDRGLRIERVAGGLRIGTRPELADVLREFVRRRNRSRLSRAALETLAVVAYRQPVTAPEIEAVRGVNPSAILKTLMEKRLVTIVGRRKVVGKPFLYGTTREFLEHFGLESLRDLPALEEFASILDAAGPGAAAEDLHAPGPDAPRAEAAEADGEEGGDDPDEEAP
jgi:segregation and condensation protein B